MKTIKATKDVTGKTNSIKWKKVGLSLNEVPNSYFLYRHKINSRLTINIEQWLEQKHMTTAIDKWAISIGDSRNCGSILAAHVVGLTHAKHYAEMVAKALRG